MQNFINQIITKSFYAQNPFLYWLCPGYDQIILLNSIRCHLSVMNEWNHLPLAAIELNFQDVVLENEKVNSLNYARSLKTFFNFF